MAEREDVHLLTSGKIDDAGRITLHKYSYRKVLLAGNGSCFDKKFNEIKPDIVHIHACWDVVAYKFQKRCIVHRIPVVLTLDKQLEPWHVHEKYLFSKLPKLMLYQRFMVKHAQVLQATTEQECDHLMRTRLRPSLRKNNNGNNVKKAWNSRVVTVKRFDITNGKTVSDMSSELLDFYSKVIDSYPFMGMSEEEIKMEDALLIQGMTENKLQYALSDDIVKMFSMMDNGSWRRIFLHSLDEGIFDYVNVGAQINGIDSTSLIDVDHVSRFPKPAVSHEKEVNGSRKMARLKADTSIPEKEKRLCELLLDILIRMESVQLHRSNFIFIYNALRFEDYDEDVLRNVASRMGMKKKLARLFQLLAERYGLEEGFMFFEPIDDNKTNKLRKMFLKAYIQ